MWFWKRKDQPQDDRTPEWASFFSGKEWSLFQILVLEYFQTKRISITTGPESGVIKDESGNEFGLLNLGQMCKEIPQSQWKKQITTHFDRLYAAFARAEEEAKLVADYQHAEEFLAVRIWPENFPGDSRDDFVVHRTDLPGTMTALVFDFPDSVRNVKPEETLSWGKSQDELFERAMSNVQQNFHPDISQQKIDEGFSVFLFSGEDFFVASQALFLDSYPQCIGKQGALVAIPHRHVMLCYPISSMDVVTAVHKFIPLVLYMHSQGPGPITDKLYWYYDNQFTDLPYKINRKTLEFIPPNDFVQMLNVLAAPGNLN